jgi:hypothetical protein
MSGWRCIILVREDKALGNEWNLKAGGLFEADGLRKADRLCEVLIPVCTYRTIRKLLD